jgi:squalene-hopene/tetraprenyl-beta-curcumene cyclase
MEFSHGTFPPLKREINFENTEAPTFTEVKRAIGLAQKYLLSHRQNDCLWDFPAYLGPHMINHYMLIMNWAGIPTAIDKEKLKKIILERQLPDGSWYQCQDLNLVSGDLNPTIFNYWGLKIMGEPINSDAMRRAREFILSRGGLEKSAIFTKIVLALYQNISWEDIPYTPYIIFSDKMVMNYTNFSQWVVPHMFAIAYLRKNRLSKNLGPQFDLSELKKFKNKKPNLEAKAPHATIDGYVVKKMLEHQQPKGTWGGYTVATLFSIVSLKHFSEHHPNKLKREVNNAIAKAVKFVHELYLNCGEGSYLGHAMDSHYWDTILAGLALAESGYAAEKLKPTADYILFNRNRDNGGIPFGFDFEYAPDVDDTSEAVLFCASLGVRKRELQKAADWLKAEHWLTRIQPSDGV